MILEHVRFRTVTAMVSCIDRLVGVAKKRRNFEVRLMDSVNGTEGAPAVVASLPAGKMAQLESGL